MYYTTHTANPLWTQVNSYKSKNRNKRTYVQAPRPGRSFKHTVPLLKLLIKAYPQIRQLKPLKDMISSSKILVNGKPAKDTRYPVHYLDYIHISQDLRQLIFEKEGKLVKFNLEKVVNVWNPIKRWYLNKGQCIINTYQNKNFTMEPTEQLFEKLRNPGSIIHLDHFHKNPKIIDVLKEGLKIELIRVTGKNLYDPREVKKISSKEDQWVIEFLDQKTEKVFKNIFKKKYVLKVKDEI